MLAEHVALSHLVSYRRGDALNLPFPDETFDVVWTQHVAMNIPDKATMYREVHRVLKPGGVLAIYDILAGPAGQVLFPVPWARLPETSFLVNVRSQWRRIAIGLAAHVGSSSSLKEYSCSSRFRVSGVGYSTTGPSTRT